MTFLTKVIRKLFLTKEIISKEGVVHFRRYRLLQTPWFAIYIHQILKSDEDLHFHDHPWHFASFILRGGYKELATFPPKWDKVRTTYALEGSLVKHNAVDAHKLTLMTPEVWTLVFTSGRARVWGYQTENGWVDFKTYRELKNAGQL